MTSATPSRSARPAARAGLALLATASLALAAPAVAGDQPTGAGHPGQGGGAPGGGWRGSHGGTPPGGGGQMGGQHGPAGPVGGGHGGGASRPGGPVPGGGAHGGAGPRPGGPVPGGGAHGGVSPRPGGPGGGGSRAGGPVAGGQWTHRQGPVYRGYDGRDFHPGQAYHGDRRGFGQNFWSERRFHGGYYRRPDGWYAHRWAYGEILPALFWARDYWLLDYWRYALSPPPYGYVWVREGSDALLIDQMTGQVVQVVYGVFY